MTDSRFTGVFENVDDLLDGVGVDDISDIETLLMFAFARPVGVQEAQDDDGTAIGFDVTISGEQAVSGVVECPVSLIELVRVCAGMVARAGPYPNEDATAMEALDVDALADDDLIAGLQKALGLVRIFNLMEDD